MIQKQRKWQNKWTSGGWITPRLLFLTRVHFRKIPTGHHTACVNNQTVFLDNRFFNVWQCENLTCTHLPDLLYCKYWCANILVRKPQFDSKFQIAVSKTPVSVSVELQLCCVCVLLCRFPVSVSPFLATIVQFIPPIIMYEKDFPCSPHLFGKLICLFKVACKTIKA